MQKYIDVLPSMAEKYNNTYYRSIKVHVTQQSINTYTMFFYSGITILPNVITLQFILTVVGAKCKVSFDVPNSLASVLGFKRSSYGVGCHASENLVDITSVNSILVHSNIIHSSYMRGTQAPVAYNFFQNAAPHNLIYFPVTEEVISTLSVLLTDQHGKLVEGNDYTFSSS